MLTLSPRVEGRIAKDPGANTGTTAPEAIREAIIKAVTKTATGMVTGMARGTSIRAVTGARCIITEAQEGLFSALETGRSFGTAVMSD